MSTTKDQRDELRRLWDNHIDPCHEGYGLSGLEKFWRFANALVPSLLDEADALAKVAAHIDVCLTTGVSSVERWRLVMIREIIEGRDTQTETPK